MFSGLPISRVLNGCWVKLEDEFRGRLVVETETGDGQGRVVRSVWFCAGWSYQIAFALAAMAFVACGSARAFHNFPAFATAFPPATPPAAHTSKLDLAKLSKLAIEGVEALSIIFNGSAERAPHSLLFFFFHCLLVIKIKINIS